MRIINKKNKKIYSYEEHIFSYGVNIAIISFIISVILFVLSILISYIFMGEAPSFVAGIGISSMLFNLCSMVNIILEIYLYKNFNAEIRNMLILQIFVFSLWIFIV